MSATVSKNPTSGVQNFAVIDAAVIRRVFDAELILRERTLPLYEILPADPQDAAIVGAAGGYLVNAFIDPVIIHQLSPDE